MRWGNKFLFMVAVFLGVGITGCSGVQPSRPMAESNLPFGAERLFNPAQPYGVQLWSENDPLIVGQNLKLHLRSMAESYISLFEFSSSEHVSSLFTNVPVQAGKTLQFPGIHSPVGYELSPPLGQETFILISTTHPLQTQWMKPARVQSGLTVLSQTPEQAIRNLKDVLDPLTPNEWNSAIISLPLYQFKK